MNKRIKIAKLLMFLLSVLCSFGLYMTYGFKYYGTFIIFPLLIGLAILLYFQKMFDGNTLSAKKFRYLYAMIMLFGGFTDVFVQDIRCITLLIASMINVYIHYKIEKNIE